MEKLGLQGSVQWLMDRVGKVTASRFKDLQGTAAKREAYLWEVVIERLTGNPTDHYANAAMQHGTEQEPFARMRYEAESGAIVEEVGFVLHPDLAGVGGSPDGFIGSDGGLEIKSPFNSANHLKTVLDGMPKEHLPQVQGTMWITGRAYWDFVSFDPRMPAPLDLYIQRIPRDEDYIKALAADVAKFIADADALLARLQPQSAAVEESAPEPSGHAPADAEGSPSDSAPAADPTYITADQAITLETLCQDNGVPLATFKKKAGVERLSQIHAARYAAAVKWLNSKREAA